MKINFIIKNFICIHYFKIIFYIVKYAKNIFFSFLKLINLLKKFVFFKLDMIVVLLFFSFNVIDKFLMLLLNFYKKIFISFFSFFM